MQLNANGIDIHYEISGRKEASVVMLSHSLGSSMGMWDPQLTPLEEQFQVLRYDIRGHGSSDVPPGAYNLEQLAEDVIALLNALSIDRVHWVGLSMGGMIGQCLALNYPERLKTIVLCDTAARIPDEAQPVWQERIDTARRMGMQALVEDTLKRWFTASFLARNPPALESIRRQFLETAVDGYVGCSEAIRNLNYLDELDRIHLPTLIIVGEDDPGTPLASAEAMQQRISGSRLVVLPSAAHLSSIEQSAPFNSALLAFLEEHRLEP
jgi:3-oxoadipate enol-lactonase